MSFEFSGATSPSTVAILAQGTNWAVADTQALFCRFDSHRSPLLVSLPIPQVHRGRCVVLCFWVSCRASFFHLAPVALYPGHTSAQNKQSHWQPAAQLYFFSILGRPPATLSGLACIIPIVALLLALIVQPKSTMGFGSLEAISPSTVAILAQGTDQAVAGTQVLFCRFDSRRPPLFVSPQAFRCIGVGVWSYVQAWPAS